MILGYAFLDALGIESQPTYLRGWFKNTQTVALKLFGLGPFYTHKNY